MEFWILARLLVAISLPLVVLAKPGDTDKQAYCALLAAKGDCDFYDQCVEQWTQACGKSGYALGYGGKYCRKFAVKLQMFNAAGQKWINNVRLCLEDQLLHSSVYAHNSSCKELNKFGYSTHPYCYVDNGFCQVVLTDKQNLDALFTTVTVSDLAWPPEAVKAICDTLKVCHEIGSYDMIARDDERLTGVVPTFLTWLAQIANDYPILSNIACDLYR